MSTYLWIDLASVVVPVAYSFHPRLRFQRNWPALFAGIGMMMLVFIPWDVLFTTKAVWGFRQEHLSGLRLLHLPIEEWLFFVCIPFACVFTYHAGVVQVPNVPTAWARWVVPILVGLLLIIGSTHPDLAYTASTTLLLAILLALLHWWLRPIWLPRALLTYGVLLFPFLIVNGLLTGTGISPEVVWYDDQENLGIRILTIPIEDTAYGLLMFLMTVLPYEALLARRVQ